VIKKSLNFHYIFRLNADNLDFIIKNLDVEAAAGDEIDDAGEHLIGMPSVITDAANPDNSPLPDIIIFHLSHGYVELIVYAADNRLQDLSFTLERHIFRKSKVDLAYTDIHCKIENSRPLLEEFILPLIYHPLHGVSNRNPGVDIFLIFADTYLATIKAV
jgi:hypothetical protein